MITKKSRTYSYFAYLFLIIYFSAVFCDEKSSITFVIDDTSSMSDEISQVKIGANAIFDSVLNSNDSQIEDFVLVTFNDPTTELRTITRDKYKFKQALSAIVVNGGGDCPEYAMSGLIKGIKNSKPGSIIYAFTDASASDYVQYEEAKSLAIKKKIQVVFVLTGECTARSPLEHKVYEYLAKDTMGQVYYLMKQDIKDIVRDIVENVKGRQAIIKTLYLPPGVNKFNVSIDPHTKDPKISISGPRPVSGANPSISLSVVGPDGSKTRTETILNKPNARIDKVLNPKPGDHIVAVGSPTETRVVVSVITDVKFQHGFSTFKPTSIYDTTTRPLPDTKSHISIKLTDGDVDLKTIKIFDMDDKLLREIPLTAVNKKDNFFTTEPVDLPNSTFKVAIVAYDPVSKTNITRVASTVAPQPKLPVSIANKAPTVSISGEPSIGAEWNKPLQLHCKVNGYPQPHIVWINKDSGEELSAKVSIVELPADFISILDIDRLSATTNFECKATNALDTASKTIEAKVTSPYITVLRPLKDTSINYLDEGKIYCKVDAYPPASLTWYKDRKPLLKNDNLEMSDDNSVIRIKSMKPSDAGSYICEIRNGFNRKTLSGKVSIANVEAPMIDKTTKAITVRSGSNAVINCNIKKGRPKPSITWTYYIDSKEEKQLDEWTDQETITIRNAYKSDTGTYTCTAKNIMGYDYHKVKLVVEYPPEIKRSSRLAQFTVEEGKSVYISCVVDGSPKPVVEWYKDSAPLTKAANIQFYSDRSIRMDVNVADSGTYTCNATNKLGSTSKVTQVNVYVPATIAIPKKSKMTIKVGDTLDLPCNVKGHPTPKTEWTYYSFNSGVSPKPLLEANGSSSIKLRRMQLGEDGYYTCKASNIGGQNNITYEIHVFAPPLIQNVYIDKEFNVVEGDLALPIQCKASGNPTPTIRWLKNGYWVAAGADISVNNGTLLLQHITKEADGVYVCEASNSLGFNREVYEVKVHMSPQSGPPTSTVTIAEGSSSVINCDVPHLKTDLLRWYKNGVLIHKGELTVTNANINDSGLYTCRVSTFTKSSTGNTMVTIGYKPKFLTPADTTIEYVESTSYILDCEAIGEPDPKYTWWHNGKIMNITENYFDFEMVLGTQGQYICDASNEFGNTIRVFNVISKDCFIDINNQPSKLQPLMLTPGLTWPKNEIRNGFMSVADQDYVILFCPKQFKTVPSVYTVAKCEGGATFKVRGKLYEFSDIECTEKIPHIIQKTGESCFDDNTELVRVVFEVMGSILDAYEVCMDMDNNRPLYTKVKMSNSVADTDYIETQWADADEIDLNLDEAYECNHQNQITSSVLGRSFHRDDGCCFGKKQLVSPKDLIPGVAQRTAYSHLNVVPHWSSCNAESNNWNEVEQRVRTLAKATYSELVVSTGVAGDLTLPNSYKSALNVFITDKNSNRLNLPTYLWKVVQEPATNSSLVIIQVNAPDLSPSEAAAYVLCRDICNNTKWMRGKTWYDDTKGFTFCCTLNEFENAFGFSGVFEPYNKVLSDVSPIPTHSLA